MVLEQLRFHRNTHLAQLELPGDYLGQALTDIRQGILVLTKLSQERPNLTIGINTDPPKGSPYMRPWPTIHDFFHDIGWSYDNEGKSLAFSRARLAFVYSDTRCWTKKGTPRYTRT